MAGTWARAAVVAAAVLVSGAARTGAVVPAGARSPGRPVAGVLPATPVDDATATLQGMTPAQRVGQVFMVGTPASGLSPATASAVRDRHVGSAILTGRSTSGVVATAGVVAALQSLVTPASTAGVGLLVSADQEGGAVQVLQGPGFSSMPTALVQGSWDPSVLRGTAAGWGRQLRAAGVGIDLAPVLDTVPGAAAARTNPPIGVYDREYGYDPATVTSHGTAFAAGLADGGVASAVKHFPGLGRVTGNPDVTSGVTDTVTVRHDPYLAPFAAAVAAGAPVVMVSTAYYSGIDPARPAAFSPYVIGQLVRGDLAFGGVVVSDDLAAAAQVAAWAPGDRALQFLSAGGDLVLCVDPGTLPAMYDAVLARAAADPGFGSRVDEAALRVLRLAQSQGLVPSGGFGAIGAKYQQLGGWGSVLGQPVTAQYATPGGGAAQDFVSGSIWWSPTTGAHAVIGAIRDDYRATGGPGGPLGYPVTDEQGVPGGRSTDFVGVSGGLGSVSWSPSTGAHAVYGAVRQRWAALGLTTGPMGFPLTDEQDVGDGVGRFNDFAGSDGATIAWSPATGAHAVYGGTRARWAALGLARGVLGYPVTDEQGVGDGVGRFNDFRGAAGDVGSVYWSPATGAHSVYGAIRRAWGTVGLATGELGYPLTEEATTPDGTGRFVDFGSGRITWRASDGQITITRR